MPGLDKSGPMGQGAQTGRKLGKCSGNVDATLEFTPRGRGLGRGFRNMDKHEQVAGRGGRRRRGMGFGFKSNTQS